VDSASVSDNIFPLQIDYSDKIDYSDIVQLSRDLGTASFERVADAMAVGGATAPPSPTPLTPISAIVGDHQRDRSPRFPNRSIALRTRKG
jgi:hypothetical protein